MLSRTTGDLPAAPPPALDWAGEDRISNLRELFEWTQRIAVEAIDWYMTEKERKARWSRALRSATAIAATIGGLVPIAALSTDQPAWGNWGFVLIALAGGCLGYDRYFGYSSAWLRYVSTATAIRALLNEFQLRWSAELAGLGNRRPDDTELIRLVDLLRGFTGAVNDAVRAETDSWLTEFRTGTNELETSVNGRCPHDTSATATPRQRVNHSDYTRVPNPSIPPGRPDAGHPPPLAMTQSNPMCEGQD